MVTQRITEDHRESQSSFVFLWATLCFSVKLCVIFLLITHSANVFAQKDTIKIGLLIQEKNSKAARRGAEMAISNANLQENKRYFTLAVRDMEGPWGTGSKVAVDLVFKEKVWAIIGAVDGRNCHLAEQVSAKTRVPFLSSWSGDPTLAYAYIPWYICAVPNDEQKASSIIDDIVSSGNTPAAIITAGDYDSGMACGSFIKEASMKGLKMPRVFRFTDGSNFDSISMAIRNMKPKNIIFYGPVSYCLKFKKLIDSGFKLYCVSYADGEKQTDKDIEGIIFVSPGYHFTKKGKEFKATYAKKFGAEAGDMAAFTYDITDVVINSARATDNPDSLKNFLKKIKIDGITGTMSFDEKGNRIRKAELMTIENGKWKQK